MFFDFTIASLGFDFFQQNSFPENWKKKTSRTSGAGIFCCCCWCFFLEDWRRLTWGFDRWKFGICGCLAHFFDGYKNYKIGNIKLTIWSEDVWTMVVERFQVGSFLVGSFSGKFGAVGFFLGGMRIWIMELLSLPRWQIKHISICHWATTLKNTSTVWTCWLFQYPEICFFPKRKHQHQMLIFKGVMVSKEWWKKST